MSRTPLQHRARPRAQRVEGRRRRNKEQKGGRVRNLCLMCVCAHQKTRRIKYVSHTHTEKKKNSPVSKRSVFRRCGAWRALVMMLKLGVHLLRAVRPHGHSHAVVALRGPGKEGRNEGGSRRMRECQSLSAITLNIITAKKTSRRAQKKQVATHKSGAGEDARVMQQSRGHRGSLREASGHVLAGYRRCSYQGLVLDRSHLREVAKCTLLSPLLSLWLPREIRVFVPVPFRSFDPQQQLDRRARTR